MRSVAQRLAADVTILDLAGQRGLGELNTEVADRIRALIAEGQTRFLLNLQDVSYLDSAGLGDLAAAYKAADKHGATLKLTNLQPRVAELLRTVNLLKAFEVFDSEDAALKSF